MARKPLNLLDVQDLQIIYQMDDYKEHLAHIIENEELYNKKYSNWTMANDKQLLSLYVQQLYDANVLALSNNLPIWAHFMYAVWDLNFTNRTKTNSEIDDLVNNL